MKVEEDFKYYQGVCYLNSFGRKKYLKAFVQRIEEIVQSGEDDSQPRWDILMRQVKRFRAFIYSPSSGYQPYLIR